MIRPNNGELLTRDIFSKGMIKMQVSANTTQLLLQSQAKNRAYDIGQKNSAAPEIVDLTSSLSTLKPKHSFFGADPNYKPVFESVARYKSADVYERKDVLGKQDVFETRAIYEEQEILETKVVGTDDLSDLASLEEAGIGRGARFSISVSDGPTAEIKFVSARKISVTVDGNVENFTFKARNGSFRDGLQDALNSIDGVSAGYTDDGKLSIEASGANSLSIADIKKSPLKKLGLSEGVTNAAVVGYQQVQTGTEQVKAGDKVVVTGSETIKVGTQQVLDGYDRKIVGLERLDYFSADDENFSSSDQDYLKMLFSVIETERNSEELSAPPEELQATSKEDGSASEKDKSAQNDKDQV